MWAVQKKKKKLRVEWYTYGNTKRSRRQCYVESNTSEAHRTVQKKKKVIVTIQVLSYDVARALLALKNRN
jgi:hypothetical protein